MSNSIIVAELYLKQKAEEIEREIEELGSNTLPCVNCGWLTQEGIDRDQERQGLISSLSEITEALEYLKRLV